MTNYELVIQQTQKVYEDKILRHPIFYVVANGLMTRKHYIAYLKETYHLVRHTSKALALVGANLPDDRRGLRGWFFTQSLDEHNHDLFCVKDLTALGENPDKVLDGTMMSGAWGLVAQNYYMAAYGNPVAIVGVATGTEGLGADLATSFADMIVEKYGIPRNATTFLRTHGQSDVGHVAEAKRALNEYVTSESDLRDIVFAREMTLRYYSQLFTDVLSVDPVALPSEIPAVSLS